MTPKVYFFGVLGLLGLAPMVAAVVEREWTSVAVRALLPAMVVVLVVKQLRSPQPPKAMTKRQLVMTLAILVPGMLLIFGMFGWLAVVTDDTAIRIACAGGILLFVGLVAAGSWILYKDHLQALAAAEA
ncbi:hypothetical protein [Kribbella endophytica]